MCIFTFLFHNKNLWGIMKSTYWTNKRLHGLNILTTHKKKGKYWHRQTTDLETVGQSPVYNTLAVCIQHEEQPMNQNPLWIRVSCSPYLFFFFNQLALKSNGNSSTESKRIQICKGSCLPSKKKAPGMTIRSLLRKSRVSKSCHEVTIFPQIRMSSVFLVSLETSTFSLTQHESIP